MPVQLWQIGLSLMNIYNCDEGGSTIIYYITLNRLCCEINQFSEIIRMFARFDQTQREITVKGKHFLQEDSPMEIGIAIAEFVKKLRE